MINGAGGRRRVVVGDKPRIIAKDMEPDASISLTSAVELTGEPLLDRRGATQSWIRPRRILVALYDAMSGRPALVVEAAKQGWQLCSDLDARRDPQAVAEGVQRRNQGFVDQLTIMPELRAITGPRSPTRPRRARCPRPGYWAKGYPAIAQRWRRNWLPARSGRGHFPNGHAAMKLFIWFSTTLPRNGNAPRTIDRG